MSSTNIEASRVIRRFIENKYGVKSSVIADVIRVLLVKDKIRISEIVNKMNSFKLIIGEEPVLRETVIEAVNTLYREGMIIPLQPISIDWAGRLADNTVISLNIERIPDKVLMDSRYEHMKKVLS